MPPKLKITKEDVVSAALEIVRNEGDGALNARRIAAELGCSTQPVFSNFASMAELKLAAAAEAQKVYEDYLAREAKRTDVLPYKTTGLGLIRFAAEQRELFKLLYMRDRSGEDIGDGRVELEPLIEMIRRQTGLDKESAYRFHIEMWVFVHGIATMIATGYLKWDESFASEMLTDVYKGLVKRYGEEK